ncbi:carbohydrate kinase (plasmid) [Pseudoalteromonas xiamenensis]|uniref:carbohydrate kinase family protein n=1 Tax=Pseudoalteromonas xiamenensis TaxID=882626 RepID=UPI0027E52AE8|nr:carbohydrate kinase [Pseudoalteromonas xiamenensis]WMN62102.1 carbohydrate kinase [Pseudoalteromonas xiamenensis]
MSLVCFGEVLIDFLSDGKTPESFTKYAGGAPANVAVAASNLGVKSAFCGMVGDDMFGRFLLDELERFGVDTQYCKITKDAKTALAFVSLDPQGERSFSFYRPPAADLLFNSSDFESRMFKEADILHVCSNSLTEQRIYKTTIHALTQAKEHGAVVSFDLNLRENLWVSTRYLTERIWHVITLSDILKLSKEELEYLNEKSHINLGTEHTISQLLSKGVKLLIITDGVNPVRFYTSKGLSGEVLTPKVTAIDTTAAGDAFVGGMLTYLDKQLSLTDIGFVANNISEINKMLEFAVRCGAFAVTKKGAFSALPTQQDIST